MSLSPEPVTLALPRPVVTVVLDGVQHDALAVLAGRGEVRQAPGTGGDEAATVAALRDADVVVVRNLSTISATVLEASPRLRVVARVGVGLDNIDVAAADRLGVVVLSPRGANAASVAEHALGLALALARRTVPLDRETRSGGWVRTAGRELAGGTWGVLGAGATGRATAALARGIGMTVLAHDPGADDDALRAEGVEPVGLDELARRSDVLSVHVPGGAATRGLVGARLLDQLPAHALLVSLGRGDVVDEPALLAALEGGRLGGAALDVREQEPPAPGPLEARDDVVLTPHVGGLTSQAQDRILRALVADVEVLLDGGRAAHAAGGVEVMTATARA